MKISAKPQDRRIQETPTGGDSMRFRRSQRVLKALRFHRFLLHHLSVTDGTDWHHIIFCRCVSAQVSSCQKLTETTIENVKNVEGRRLAWKGRTESDCGRSRKSSESIHRSQNLFLHVVKTDLCAFSLRGGFVLPNVFCEFL